MATTANGLVTAELSDAPNGPGGLLALAQSVDARYGLTVANFAALAGIATPFAGMRVWVTTPGDYYTYTGTAWVRGGAGAWTAYTPTWASSGTAPALGNGTLTGFYLEVDKTVLYRINLLAGNTTTFGTGAYTFTAPATANTTTLAAAGSCTIWDNSATAIYGFTAAFATTTTITAYSSTATRLGQTVPFTFANLDQVSIVGMYEAA